MDLIEKKMGGVEKFKGRIFDVVVDDVSLPDGTTSKREVVRHKGAVCVAPLTEKKELVFVRQFRYPLDKVLLELPAGRINPGEDPETTGMRELSEETGYIAKKMVFMGQLYPTPGYSDEVIWLYASSVDPIAGKTNFDDDEFVETILIPIDDAVRMVMNNEIEDSKTQALILKLRMVIENNSFML